MDIRLKKTILFLPKLKALKWINNLDILLSLNKVHQKQLEHIIRKLNHAPFLLPLNRYFYIDYDIQNSFKKIWSSNIKPMNQRRYHPLQRLAVNYEYRGNISIQIVTHSLPDIICWSDACEFGSRGFSNKGKTW